MFRWLSMCMLATTWSAAAQSAFPAHPAPLTNRTAHAAQGPEPAGPGARTSGSSTPMLEPLLAPPPVVVEQEAAYIIAPGEQYDGECAAGPGEYFVVWTDLRAGAWSGAFADLYGQRVLPDGSTLAPGSIALLKLPGREVRGIPTVGWSGSLYLVVWHEFGGTGRLLYGMRVTPAGEVLDPGGFLIGAGPPSGEFAWPAVASSGTEFLVVQARSGNIEGFRVGLDGTVLDPAPLTISSGASGLGFPKLAYGDGTYLVAWAQAPPQMIRAARVTPAGEVLDPGGFSVSGTGTDVDAFVTFDGTNFYVIWSRDSGAWDVWGAHVSPAGAVIDPQLVLDGSPWNILFAGPLAFNGTHHLVALDTSEPIYSNNDLYALRIDLAGTAAGGPFAVETTPAESTVAFGAAAVDDQFFLSWERAWVRGIFYTYDTEGARIAGDGTVLDPPPGLPLSTCAAWQLESAVSFDGANFLCVFEDWREGKPAYQSELWAVRVSPAGAPLDSTAIHVASGLLGHAEQAPESTFGGGQHAVVYEQNVGAVNEVRMSRVLPDGTPLDPEGILIFANEPTGDTFRPKIAWNGTHYCVVWLDQLLYPGQQPLQFALVNVDGTIDLGPVNIPASSGTGVYNFELTSDGNNFLLAWIDFDTVNATRISPAGAVLGTSVLYTSGSWIAEIPSVAFNGESYLVAWRQWAEDGIHLYARRVSQSGTPLGSVFSAIDPQYEFITLLEVLSLDADFLVIATRRPETSPEAPVELVAARFDAAGLPVGAPVVLDTPPMEMYAGSATTISPAGTLLVLHSLWARDPYNAPRAHAQVFALGDVAGDLNCDGVLNVFDIDPFVLALTDPAAYAAAYPECDIALADMNDDGVVNAFDIDPFVAALAQGGGADGRTGDR